MASKAAAATETTKAPDFEGWLTKRSMYPHSSGAVLWLLGSLRLTDCAAWLCWLSCWLAGWLAGVQVCG